jgi:hypothetical protein
VCYHGNSDQKSKTKSPIATLRKRLSLRGIYVANFHDGTLEQMPKEICARAASQAPLKELLGKGLARRGTGDAYAPQNSRRCHHFGDLFWHLL